MALKVLRQISDPGISTHALVLLHGLGADEADLAPLAEAMALPISTYLFRAPHETGFGGYAWYPIQFDASGGRHYNPDDAMSACKLVIGELEALRSTHANLILGGFSQGAITSLGVALQHPDLLSGLILWSALLNPEFVPETVSDAFRTMPKFVAHGVFDQVLPIAEGRKIRSYLESVQAEYTYQEYPMAHEISAQSFHDTLTFLRPLIPVD